MQSLEYYEQKIISDSEFPVQMFVNDVGKKVWYFNQHWHEHIELHYVLEGRTTLRLGQREIPAGEGNLVVVNSNELHAGYCDGTHMRVLVIIFDMGDFYKELADKNVIFQSLVERDETIDAIMSAIQKEYSEQRIGYRLICKGELLHLIVHLAREYAAEVLYPVQLHQADQQQGAGRHHPLKRGQVQPSVQGEHGNAAAPIYERGPHEEGHEPAQEEGGHGGGDCGQRGVHGLQPFRAAVQTVLRLCALGDPEKINSRIVCINSRKNLSYSSFFFYNQFKMRNRIPR